MNYYKFVGTKEQAKAMYQILQDALERDGILIIADAGFHGLPTWQEMSNVEYLVEVVYKNIPVYVNDCHYWRKR